MLDLDLIRKASFVKHVEWHDILPSTNDRGIELAGNGKIATPLLILAGEQSAGRGRGLNRWWSDAGALTFSLVFDPAGDQLFSGAAVLEAAHWPKTALAAAVALCDVMQESLSNVPCALKWPNDVLLQGRKVAGILAEVPPNAPLSPRRLVLGMGINVNNSLTSAPAEVKAVGTAICDVAEAPVDATGLLIEWLSRFAGHLQALAVGDRALPARWQSLCALTGKRVEVQSGNRSVRGQCHGIDADGALVVDTDSGLERIYAGVLVRIVE